MENFQNSFLPSDWLLLDRMQDRVPAASVVAVAPVHSALHASNVGISRGAKRRSPAAYDAFSVHRICDGPLFTLAGDDKGTTYLSVLKRYIDCIVSADGRQAHYKAGRIKKIQVPVIASTVMVDIPLAYRQGALVCCWTARCACAEPDCSLAFKLCLYSSEEVVDEPAMRHLVVEVGGATCAVSDVVAFVAAATCAPRHRATTVVLNASTRPAGAQLPVTPITMGRGPATPGCLYFYNGPDSNSRYEVGFGTEDEVRALFAGLPSGPHALVCTRSPVRRVPAQSVFPERIQDVR
jgi:hypothetical protein